MACLRPRKLQKSSFHGAPSAAEKSGLASSSISKGINISSEDWTGGKDAPGKARATTESWNTADATHDKLADDNDEYRCPIVEETPPSPNDT